MRTIEKVNLPRELGVVKEVMDHIPCPKQTSPAGDDHQMDYLHLCSPTEKSNKKLKLQERFRH